MKTLDEAKDECAKGHGFGDWDEMVATYDLSGDHVDGYYQEVVKIVIDSLNRWRPIETAPKDGTWVLLLHESPSDPTVSVRQYRLWNERSYGDGTKEWVTKEGFANYVNVYTHWMPLPESPKDL